jgi:hypothetical protein
MHRKSFADTPEIPSGTISQLSSFTSSTRLAVYSSLRRACVRIGSFMSIMNRTRKMLGWVVRGSFDSAEMLGK